MADNERIIADTKLNIGREPLPENKKYNFGLDIVRLLAMFLVVSVHSTTFNGFIAEIEFSAVNFFVAAGRYFSFICVPLFIMLSGYLCCEKKISMRWYGKIVRILLEYLICSIILYAFRKSFMKENFTATEVIEQIFSFDMAPYAWYVNMYLGLFLLIPFLNLLYKNIPDKGKKQFFIVMLAIIFAIPATFMRLRWDYWNIGYPLMYYFIGCYIKEYQPKPGIIFSLLTIVVLIAFESFLLLWEEDNFYTENHNNIFCLGITTLTFLLLYRFSSERNNTVYKILRTLANTSLSFFLLSYIFDQVFTFYVFKRLGLELFSEKLAHFLYIVPLTIIGSVAAGIITHFSTNGIISVCSAAADRINYLKRAYITKKKEKIAKIL